MKFLVIPATLLSCASLVCAQEPPLPAATETPTTSPGGRPELNIPEIPLPAATETPTASPSVRPELDIPEIPLTVEPTPLVPNMSPAPKKSAPPITELDAAFKQSSLGKAAEEQRLHVEWRQLKNRTVHDPEVVAAKTAAERARTDLQKRDLLRAYYNIYYAHMQALATKPELKAYLEAKKKAILRGLDQPHVRPQATAEASPEP